MALLGTPHGMGVVWMKKEHSEELGVGKGVESATAFREFFDVRVEEGDGEGMDGDCSHMLFTLTG